MSMIRFKEDDMLLRAFVESQSEQAFSDLVERHVDLVSRVVYRRIEDHASAQDVVQSVFTLLARKASILLDHPTIAGWLGTKKRIHAARSR